jgi:thioredoxin-like negative regulator of GroEL
VFGIAGGKLVDKFEGLPPEEQLNAFLKTMLDHANAAVGPVSVANSEFEAGVQVIHVVVSVFLLCALS